MRTVLIGTNYNSSAADVSVLTDAQIGIFAGHDSNSFTIGGGRYDRITQSISKTPRQLQLKRITPVTAVKQSKSIIFSYGGANTYDEFVIRVNINYYKGSESRNSNAQVFSFTGIYADSAAVASKAASVINTTETSEVVASVSGNKVVITPKDRNKQALIDVAGEFFPFTGNPAQTVTVAEETARVIGVGDRDYIIALEGSARMPADRTRTETPFEGLLGEDASFTSFPLDTYCISFLNENHIDGRGLGLAFSPLNEVYVCLPAGTNATAFETAIETLFGKSFENGAS